MQDAKAKKGRSVSISPRGGKMNATTWEQDKYLVNIHHDKSPEGRNNGSKWSNRIAIFVFWPPEQGIKNRINRACAGLVSFDCISRIDTYNIELITYLCGDVRGCFTPILPQTRVGVAGYTPDACRTTLFLGYAKSWTGAKEPSTPTRAVADYKRSRTRSREADKGWKNTESLESPEQ